MTILEKNNFRIQTISRFGADSVLDLPISEGLGVERTTDDGKSYFVVGFVNYNKEKDEIVYEDICFRTFDLEADDWDLFKDLVSVAAEMVRLANR